MAAELVLAGERVAAVLEVVVGPLALKLYLQPFDPLEREVALSPQRLGLLLPVSVPKLRPSQHVHPAPFEMLK